MSRRPTSVPATTPLLRPTSARPQTSASSRPEGHSIVALLEGRGISREIGMATLNPDTGRATMVQVRSSLRRNWIDTQPISLSKFDIQLSDLPTYVKTLHQMHIHYPSLVLVPDTFLSPHTSSDAKASLLIDSIEGEFEDVPIEPVKRKYWNETVGEVFCPESGRALSLTRFIQASSLSPSSLWTMKKEPPPFCRLLPSLATRDLHICAWTQLKSQILCPLGFMRNFQVLRDETQHPVLCRISQYPIHTRGRNHVDRPRDDSKPRAGGKYGASQVKPLFVRVRDGIRGWAMGKAKPNVSAS